MTTFRINDDSDQAEALIAYLQSLPFVEFMEEENESEDQEEFEDSNEEIDPEAEKKLEKFDVKEIAGELDLGMRCYVNKTTGELIAIPEELDMIDDDEGLLQEMVDKVEENIDDYIILSPPKSWESFDIMKSFVEKVSQPRLRQQLADALEKRKPFRNFSNIINSSEVREKWYEHKSQKERDLGREQLLNELD